MEPTEILIKVKLSPKVLEGLDNDRYFALYNGGSDWSYVYLDDIKFHSTDLFSHIYLPLTVTTEMVEKEASEYAGQNFTGIWEGWRKDKKAHFIAGIRWLLSFNKEN